MPELAQFPRAPREPAWRGALREQKALGALGLALVLASASLALGGGLDAETRETVIGIGLLPGAFLALLWLRYIVRYRVLLRHGELAFGAADGARYTFRDASGNEFHGRARGGVTGRVVVVFDPREPRVNRAVTPDDFVREA